MRALLLLVAVMLLVPSTAEGARSCAKGKAPFVLEDGRLEPVAKRTARARCFALPEVRRAGAAAVRGQAALAARAVPARVRKALRRRALRRLALGRTVLPRLLAPRSGASRVEQTATGPIESGLPEGATGTETVTVERPDPDESGGYREVVVDVERSRGDARLRQGMGQGSGGFLGRCPSAAGIVTGTAKRRWLTRTSGTDGTRSVAHSFDAVTEAKVTVHVGDDARVATYDYDATLVLEIDARTDGRRMPTRVYRARSRRTGIDPRARLSADQEASALLGQPFRAWGPQGDLSSSEWQLVLLNATLQLTLLKDELDDLVRAAERPWYEGMECVEVRSDPASATVETGGSIEVGLDLASKVDGSRVRTPVAYTSPCAAPATGTLPARVTFSDPQRVWRPFLQPCSAVTAVSRRGRADGGPDLEVSGEQRFRVTVEGSQTFVWTANRTREEQNCTLKAAGEGTRAAYWEPPAAGEGPLVRFDGTRLWVDTKVPIQGRFGQEGHYGATGCGAGQDDDTSGCGSRDLRGFADVRAVAGTTVHLTYEGDDAFDQLFDRCPITWPSVLTPDGTDVLPLGPQLEDDYDLTLPLDQLANPDVPVVSATGNGEGGGREFCSASGSNNGGQCGPEETVEVTSWKVWTSTVKLTRVTGPA